MELNLSFFVPGNKNVEINPLINILTLRMRSSVWNLKKMPVISLYWFAAQQRTSTCRRQKSSSIYSKFSVEESEFTPSFQNPQEVA